MGTFTLTDKFQGIFTGYDKGFVKHTPPFTKDEKGKLKAKWAGIAKYKLKDKNNPPPPPGFEVDDMVPLDREHYRMHLEGLQGLAISPLFDMPNGTKNVCLYSVIDIDVVDPDGIIYIPLVARLYERHYKFAAFVSKSGGLHIYFFYKSAEKASEVRVEMKRIVETFGMHKIFDKKVEVFPEHETRSPDKWDKCVFLPFYGSGQKGGSNQLMITAAGELEGITKAIPHIEDMITSLDEVRKATDELPWSDAPFCVQALLLNGGPANNFNDFLFTASIYLKRKHRDGLEKAHIEEMNNGCTDPTEQKQVEGVFSSVSKTDYQQAGRCDKEPVCGICDRQLCKTREFGVGREKKNTTSTVEFGKIYRMLADEPYYLWEARVAGTEEYVKLRIDTSADFLNQKVVQKACIDELGQVPPTVVPKFWEDTLNLCLSTIENVPVARPTDTTDLSELRRLFKRYLTHGQARNSRPQTVFVKQVYFNEGFFYFQTDGFQEYLRVSKYTLGRVNLREQLIQYGCIEGSLSYKTGRGEVKSIECWKKAEDDELKSLGTFYEDVLDSDTQIVTENPLNKPDTNNGHVTPSGDTEEPRF